MICVIAGRFRKAFCHPAEKHQTHREGTRCHRPGPIWYWQNRYILNLYPAEFGHTVEGNTGPVFVTNSRIGGPDSKGNSAEYFYLLFNLI